MTDSRDSAVCFDATAIDRLADMLMSEDPAELDAFIDECLCSVAALIAKTDDAAAMSADDLRRAVHTLGSTSALLGAELLSARARHIERQMATDPGADIAPLLADLRPAHEQFLRALEHERAGWATP